MHKIIILAAFLAIFAADCGAALADSVAVVDTARIFKSSKPGKAAEEHMRKVRSVLLKGLNDLQEAYKGRENTPEGVDALREGQAALERQLAVERQAVSQVLAATLENVIRVWVGVNKQYDVVLSKDMVLGSNRRADVTDSILNDMDKENPQFPDLPKVTVSKPVGK